MAVSDVRRHHLSVALEHLVRNGAQSRTTIAREIGLTKATVSALIADLLDRELVEELQPGVRQMGRPALDVAASSSVGALGLEVAVDHVAAAVVDLSGEIRIMSEQTGSNRDAHPDAVIDRLRAVASNTVRRAEDRGIRCSGGGLALPGLVDPASGALFVAPNLHWLDVEVPTAGEVGLPAAMTLSVDNEANLGALAELRYGSGKQRSSFVYVSGGIGIGAAIVIDERIVHGAHGFAGELGHVVVDPGGKRCSCGARGCLETIAGSQRRSGRVEVADALVIALRTVVHLVDPELIVLGGTLAGRGPSFADEVRTRLRATTLGARWRPVDVGVSRYGADAALVGAATMALDDVIADPTVVPDRRAARPA